MASKTVVQIPNFTDMLNVALKNSVQEVSLLVQEQAKKTAPKDTGNYIRNISYDGKNTVTAHANYSAAIEYGITSPVIIRPKSAKALRFTVGGKVVYAKFVQQKTRRPNPVMRNAARSAQKQVQAIFDKNFARVK